MHQFLQNMGWDTLCATFPQTHLVTIARNPHFPVDYRCHRGEARPEFCGFVQGSAGRHLESI
jgi:hypothetical protein